MTNETKGLKKGTKEVDSMKTVAAEHSGYKRLNFGTLNFADNKNVIEDSVEDITPIKWAKDVFAGEKQVIIKKQ